MKPRYMLLFGLCLLISIVPVVSAVAQDCSSAPPTRLRIGEEARVTPGLPNNVRNQAGKSGQYIGEIPGGAFFTVLEGPVCSSGMYWWRVRYGQLEGWTPEGDNTGYWLEPTRLIPTATHTPTPTITPTFTPTLTFTPSLTPSSTSTPTITPTLRPLIATAQALGFDLQVENNYEWPSIRQVFREAEMMLVPAGCYNRNISDKQMEAITEACQQTSMSQSGACPTDLPDERVDQTICFEKPFWIDRYEVTVLQYETLNGPDKEAHPFNYVRWGDNYPRFWIEVSDAARYCWLRDARLPSDIEWEYAARGPNGWIFPWGDFFQPDYAIYWDNAERYFNTDGSSLIKPAEVAATTTDISWAGVYNLAGNVSEFVVRAFPDELNSETMRGGDYNSYATELRLSRPPNSGRIGKGMATGFRCARDFQISDLELPARG